MKAWGAVIFFLVEAAALVLGVFRAANGQGIAVLAVTVVVLTVVFAKFGCIDNASDAH
jgi:hypothetical protein